MERPRGAKSQGYVASLGSGPASHLTAKPEPQAILPLLGVVPLQCCVWGCGSGSASVGPWCQGCGVALVAVLSILLTGHRGPETKPGPPAPFRHTCSGCSPSPERTVGPSPPSPSWAHTQGFPHPPPLDAQSPEGRGERI